MLRFVRLLDEAGKNDKMKGEVNDLLKDIIKDLFLSDYEHFKRFLKSRYNELNEYDIEDIIQQTVLKLLYLGDDLLGIRNLSAYVYSALRNGAIDYFRKSKKEILSDEYIEGEGENLESHILSAELKKVIKKAINGLDLSSRYVFIETEIKGRSYKELVHETGEKLGTLLSRKSRAAKKLKKALTTYIR